MLGRSGLTPAAEGPEGKCVCEIMSPPTGQQWNSNTDQDSCDFEMLNILWSFSRIPGLKKVSEFRTALRLTCENSPLFLYLAYERTGTAQASSVR